MANETMLKTRHVQKHDIEANWIKAGDNPDKPFIPLLGEFIIYDPDSTHTYSRIKMGDGVTNVKLLPFIDAHIPVESGLGENSLQIVGGIAKGQGAVSLATSVTQEKSIYYNRDNIQEGVTVTGIKLLPSDIVYHEMWTDPGLSISFADGSKYILREGFSEYLNSEGNQILVCSYSGQDTLGEYELPVPTEITDYVLEGEVCGGYWHDDPETDPRGERVSIFDFVELRGIITQVHGAADGDYSFVTGLGTTAREGQIALGRYNKVEDDAILMIGNGYHYSSDAEPTLSNAYTLDQQGNGWYSGNIIVNGGTLTVGETTLTEAQLIKILNFIDSIEG